MDEESPPAGGARRRGSGKVAVLSKAATAGVAFLAVYCMVIAMGGPGRPGARVALEAVRGRAAADFVRQTYADDAAMGERIIGKMRGRVHNELWTELVGNPTTRRALAAALGAERLQPGAGAFNLGNLLSGMPRRRRAQVRQQLRLNSPDVHGLHGPVHGASSRARKPLSPLQEWERGQERAGAAATRVSTMSGRLTRGRLVPSLPMRQPTVVPAKTAEHHASQHAFRTQFVLDEFAPGVLPAPGHGHAPASGVVKSGPPEKTAAVPTASASKHSSNSKLAAVTAGNLVDAISKWVAPVKKGVQKATGFDDAKVTVGETVEDKLEKQIRHLKALNAAEKREFEKREKHDVEQRLVALEAKQLNLSTSASNRTRIHRGPSSVGTVSAFRKSAASRNGDRREVRTPGPDELEKALLLRSRAALQAAAQHSGHAVSARAMLTGAGPHKMSASYLLHVLTPQDTATQHSLRTAEEAQARKLEAEVAQQTADIFNAKLPDPFHTARQPVRAARAGPTASGRQTRVKATATMSTAAGHDAASRGRHRKKPAGGGGHLYEPVHGKGGWRALADKSKALAKAGPRSPRSAARMPAGAGASGAHASAAARAALTADAGAALHVVAAGKRSTGGTSAGKRGRRGRQRKRGGSSGEESWETEIRQDSLPIACGLPLVAEASGLDCNVVKRVHRLKGHNRIHRDLTEIGLGDDEIGVGDQGPSGQGPFRRGGALGQPNKKFGTQLTPTRAYSAGSAINALGYTSAAQYESALRIFD